MPDGNPRVSDDSGDSREPDPLFDALPDPAFLADFGGEEPRVLRLNEAFAETFGYDAASAVGTPVDDLLVGPASMADVEASDRLADGVGTCEVCRETADGREREYLFRSVPVDGADERVYGLYTDITDRTAYEANLTALHETAQELMAAETAEDVLDIGVHTAREILGYEMTAIHLYDESAKALVPAVTTAATRELLDSVPTFEGGNSIAWRAFETGQAIICDNVREDPDVFNDATPVRSEMLFPLGDHGVLLVVSTEVAAFEESDRSLGGVLAANIQSALQQVEREQALARQNERLDEFATVLSHDLRTPLDLAGAHLELATEGYDEAAHLEDVATAHRRMSDLIDDVLAWAREGDAVEAADEVELSTLLADCWADREPDGPTLDIATEQTVTGDRSRLRQLFDNLLGNAVDYAGPDASITVGDLDDDAGIYVADDGPGIPADERESVFEFGHSLSAESTGFGLAIVDQVVDAHDWSITLTESESGGARFEIRF